jgi:mono/diheme cytochrome c family protein
MIHPAISTLLLAVLTGLAACNESPRPPDRLLIAGADPKEGRKLIQVYGCGTCHVIDGIAGARGQVGPPLDDYAQRHLLAGILPNTPRYLVPWIVNPVALDPRTGMPSLGVREQEARHIASYLYTLGAAKAEVYPPDPPLALQVAGRPSPAMEALEHPMRISEFEPRTRRIAPVPGADRD